MNKIYRVSSSSNPSSIASSMTYTLKQENKVELMTMGAGALNQALKAVAIARGFMAPLGIDLICIPAFTEVIADDSKETRTAMKLIVEAR